MLIVGRFFVEFLKAVEAEEVAVWRFRVAPNNPLAFMTAGVGNGFVTASSEAVETFRAIRARR